MDSQTVTQPRAPTSSSPKADWPTTAAPNQSRTSATKTSAKSPHTWNRCCAPTRATQTKQPSRSKHKYGEQMSTDISTLVPLTRITDEQELLELERKYCSWGDTVHYLDP